MKRLFCILGILSMAACSSVKPPISSVYPTFETKYREFVSENSKVVIDSLILADSLPDLTNWGTNIFKLEDRSVYFQKFITIQAKGRFIVISVDSLSTDSLSTVKYRVE